MKWPKPITPLRVEMGVKLDDSCKEKLTYFLIEKMQSEPHEAQDNSKLGRNNDVVIYEHFHKTLTS